MDYVQVSITCLEDYREILIAELAAVGFDSFLETETGFEAYVPQDQFSRDSFDEVIATYREPAAHTPTDLLRLGRNFFPTPHSNSLWA